jgi:serine protease Do
MPNASELNDRSIRQASDPYKIYQLDAIAYPGNSGSPLWSPETGEVYGVVNSVFVKGAKEAALTDPSGISYAIPSTYLEALLKKPHN